MNRSPWYDRLVGRVFHGDRPATRERGQLVLVAAVVLALALVPLVLAYLQLGYHADVQASAEYHDPAHTARQYLQRAVAEAGTTAGADDPWGNRNAVTDGVHTHLDPHLEMLSTADVERGTVARTSYNQSAADAWAAANCPDGPNRQFGGCVAHRGVIVQERAGRTHVLGVGLDVSITTERGTWELTTVVRMPDVAAG